MDLIKKDINNKVTRQLLNDHIPNRAFRNEFQSNDFTFKLHYMELYEQSDNSHLLVCEVSIRSNVVEPLELLSDDFLLSCNEEDPIVCELEKTYDTQFDEYFILDSLSTKTGKLVYKIKGNIQRLTFLYYDYFDDGNSKRYRLRYKV